MSELKKFEPITNKDITGRGVQALADRPNASGQYGVGGLSPADLKKWFDNLAVLLARRINEMQSAFASDAAGDYVRIPLDVGGDGIGTLADLIASFADGSFAKSFLFVNYDETDVPDTLEYALKTISKTLSAHADRIQNTRKNNVAHVSVDYFPEIYELKFEMFNEDGEVIDGGNSFDLRVGTGGILYHAVTNEKLAPESVSADKIEAGAVETEKISAEAVTGEKVSTDAIASRHIAAGSVTREKIAETVLQKLDTAYRQGVHGVSYNVTSGVITFTGPFGNEIASVDLPLELLVQRGYIDETAGGEAIVLVLSNGEEIRIPLDFLTDKVIADIRDLEASIKSAEEVRKSSEAVREAREADRVSAEQTRASSESARISAESERKTAEASRKEAEANRISAEAERKNTFEGWSSSFTDIDNRISDNEAGIDENRELIEAVGHTADAAAAYIDANAASIAETVQKASRNEKSIINLEQGLMADAFETDASVAYVKDVPANALPYAAVAKVGGMTHKDGDTLKNAKVTEIESVGKNYAVSTRGDSTVADGITLSRQIGSSSAVLNGTATKENSSPVIEFFRLPAGEYTASVYGLNTTDRIYIRDTNGNVLVNYIQTNAPKTFTITEEKECRAEMVYLAGSAYSNTEVKVQVESGNTATEFSPYTTHTLPIPEAVQALDGYGYGVEGTYNNHVDLEKKKFVKRVETLVVTGTENITFGYNRFGIVLSKNAVLYTQADCVCNKYDVNPTVYQNAATENGVLADRRYCYVRDMSYSTVEAFKAYLAAQYASGTPVTFVYALETPEITDISDILPADNLLGVEGGGTITAVNENALAAPTEIIYQLKEA